MKRIYTVCGAVIFEGRKFMLVKQGRGSSRGKWCYPGGQIEVDEDILSAAKREVREETGLEVELQSLVGVQDTHNKRAHLIVFIFKGMATGGKIRPAEGEILEARWFTPEEFWTLKDSELRYTGMRGILKKCLEEKGFPLSLFNSLQQ